MIQAPQQVKVDIVGSLNPGRYPKQSRESTYNMIVSDSALVPYAGYKKVLEIRNAYVSRAAFVSTIGGFMVTVAGNDVYKVTVANLNLDTLLYEQIGTIDTTSGDVEICENGNSEISICDGFVYYVWNYSTGAFGAHTVFDAATPNSITESLTYVFVTALDGNTAAYSLPNNAISFPTNENTFEIGSDVLVRVQEFKEFVFAFGKKKTKIWTDRGLDVNPFQLDQSLVIEYGAVSKASVASGCGYIAWVGISATAGLTILASDGSEPQIVSTDGIDYILSQLTKPSDCHSFIYKQDGHVFFQTTFATDNLSLVYDFTGKAFYYATDENQNYHIAKNVVYFNNRYYLISFNDPNIYELSTNYTTYDGAVIPRIRITSPHKDDKYDLMRINYLDVIAEQGVAEEQMYVDLSFSKDGARAFSNYIRIDMANLGRSDGLIRYHNLGASRDWTFQFRFWGTGRFVILDSNASLL